MTRLSIWGLVLCGVAGALEAHAVPQEMTLDRAIALAQERSLTARSAADNLDASRWRAREFNARYLPQLSLSGQTPSFFRRIDQVTQPDGTVRFVGRTQTQSSLSLQLQQQLPLTGGELYFSSNLMNSSNNDSRFWSSSPVVVGLRQNLFRINTFGWDARAQALSARMAERQYLEQREDVAGQTATLFFDAFRVKMSLRNALDNVAVNDTLYRLNTGRYEVGKIGEDDLLQSELAWLRARASAEEAQLSYERAMGALRIQLGMAAGEAFDIVPPTGIPEVKVDTALAVEAARRNRSAAVNRELQHLQAERSVREARSSAGLGATVTAELGYNQTAPTFGDAYRSLLGQQQIAVGIQVPLMQWGGGKARVEAARAAQRSTENMTQLEELQQAQEAYFAARGLAQLQRQVALAAKADSVAAKRFDVAKNRYLIGKIDGTTLFGAQNEKDAARQAYVQGLGAYWVAYYQLRRLTLYDFATGKEISLTGRVAS